MSSNLYLLKYNNYYNRLVKREEGTSAYLDYLAYELNEINFNPGDGIDAQQIVNTAAADYDYLVVTTSSGEIESRWFVIQAIRTLGGQYQLSLHRDLIADYYDEVLKAPMYVERAVLNQGSPLIFNSENMQFNQIKKREIELGDGSNTRWIVGYCATNAFDPYISDNVEINPGEILAKPRLIAEDTSLLYSDLKAYADAATLVDTNVVGANTKFSIYYNYQKNVYDSNARRDDFNFTNRYLSTTELGDQGIDYRQYVNYNSSSFDNTQSAAGKQAAIEEAFNTHGATLKEAIETALGTLAPENSISLDDDTIQTLLAHQNKSLRDSEGNVFVYSIEKVNNKSKTFTLTTTNGGSLWSAYVNFMQIASDNNAYAVNSTFDEVGFTCSSEYEAYRLTLSISPDKGYKTTLTTNARDLSNAPYKMFAIPYDPVWVARWVGMQESGVWGSFFETDPLACRGIAAQIALNLSGSGSLYDLQILPYCPIPAFLDYMLVPSGQTGAGPHFGVAIPYDDPSGVVHSVIVDDTTDTPINCGIVLFAETDSFSFTIKETIDIPIDDVEFKVEHETSMWRLNSPNYNGVFEFKATSNRGVKGFEVNCTYKPYQPYIHVNPIFNSDGLYGGDYNDARGLVCSGDFSFPTTSDAWKTYQIQNKSYADAHYRQIDNMDTTYDIQREQAKTAGILGAISAGISGAASGGIAGSAGGPVGTAIGATIGGIAGAVTSGIGAAKDLEYADRLHQEAKSYAQDQYNLNLRNIQAQPYSLGRVGGLTINNKRSPFLEYYTCTDTEKQALRNKITYTGMTVNAIGSINDYKHNEKTFIRGQLIRLENLADDYHTITAIAGELHKGIYI